jgi:hypothetical protein
VTSFVQVHIPKCESAFRHRNDNSNDISLMGSRQGPLINCACLILLAHRQLNVRQNDQNALL